MLHGQISQEQLLDKAKALVAREGAQALSIRRLAAECGVSVGSIYNYFPAKSDLLAAVVGDFWREALHSQPLPQPGEPFETVVSKVYERLYGYFQTFAHDWLAQLTALPQPQREQSKQAEAAYLAHMQQRLLEALLADATLSPALWDDALTPQALVSMTLMVMLASLRQKQPDVRPLLALLQRILHP